MNKQEKLISLLLGLALVGWFWYSFNQQKKAAAEAARNPQPAAQVQPAQNAAPAAVQAAPQKPVEAPKPKKQKASRSARSSGSSVKQKRSKESSTRPSSSAARVSVRRERH